MEYPNRELEYITSCLEYKLFAGRAFPFPSPDLDWDKLYVLVQKQRLSGHMYMLGQNIATGWDENFAYRLRLDYYQYSLYGEYCSGHIKRILEALTSLGIRVIVLKGWAHIQTIYGRDFGQRLCEDIDILVHPDDVDAVEAVFDRQNYIVEEQSWPGYNRRYHNGTRYFVPNSKAEFGGTFSVGLHWGLMHIPSYDPRQIDVDALFATSMPLSIMGIQVLQLAPEDEIAYLCGHVGLHHRFDDAIFRYYEVAALLVMTSGELDWSKIIEKAIRWCLVLQVRKTLGNIEESWKGLLDSEVLSKLDAIQPKLRERILNFWIENTRGQPVFDHILKWFTFPRIWERPLIMLQDIFPGPEYMVSRYGDAPLGLWPLLYLRRFFGVFHIYSNS